jgi:hypothetical protein
VTLVLAVSLCGGCTRHDVPGTFAPVVVCGTTLHDGPMALPLFTLDPAKGDGGPAPSGDVLPPIGGSLQDAGFYVRVSGSCASGVTVVVRPVTGASLYGVVYARDHKIVALGLMNSESVVVEAWSRNHLIAERTFPAGS